MDRSQLIVALFAMTLIAVAIWGIVQFRAVRRSQAKRGEEPGVAGTAADHSPGARDVTHHAHDAR